MITMQMNSYYTNISQKSYDAYVKDRRDLDQVLCALIVDPDEAADAAKEYGLELPHSLDAFQSYSLKLVEMMKQTLAQWAMTMDRADQALGTLAAWSRRFGAWGSCAVARSVLSYVPSKEKRPLRAIELTESWVIGAPDAASVRKASLDSYDAASSYGVYGRVNYACLTACQAADVSYSDDAALSANRTARYAVSAILAAGDGKSRLEELSRHREVVANACLTFPG